MVNRSRPRIRLVHWNPEEAAEKAATLRSAGFNVDANPFVPATWRKLRATPPGAIVIDLSRLPSAGRDVAMAVRASKATRRIPIVFADGDPEKVARIAAQLPDALYVDWRRIRSSLRGVIARPPPVRVVPRSSLDGYSRTPLPNKLGIRPGALVALINAPRGFDQTLGSMPDGVVLRRDAPGRSDVTVWFTMSRADLERRIPQMVPAAENGGLWIAWPKRASGVTTDLTEPIVREVALDAGLVDYKVCSIDATWSGLRFSRRKSE